MGRRQVVLEKNYICNRTSLYTQNQALDLIEASPKASLLENIETGSVTLIEDAVMVHTSQGPIKARYVFDTRPEAGGRIEDHHWTLVSWLARTKGDPRMAPRLSLSPAEASGKGVEFAQHLILPDGDKIVECVRLCPPGDDAPQLKDRLSHALEGGQIIGAPKRIVLPIVPPHRDSQIDRSLFTLRAGAGGLRFSIGMEIDRLHDWSERAAQSLSEGKPLPPPRRPSWRARRFHRQLLNQLALGPDMAARWLNTIMGEMKGDDALMALAGEPSWAGLAALEWFSVKNRLSALGHSAGVKQIR